MPAAENMTVNPAAGGVPFFSDAIFDFLHPTQRPQPKSRKATGVCHEHAKDYRVVQQDILFWNQKPVAAQKNYRHLLLSWLSSYRAKLL